MITINIDRETDKIISIKNFLQKRTRPTRHWPKS